MEKYNLDSKEADEAVDNLLTFFYILNDIDQQQNH